MQNQLAARMFKTSRKKSTLSSLSAQKHFQALSCPLASGFSRQSETEDGLRCFFMLQHENFYVFCFRVSRYASRCSKALSVASGIDSVCSPLVRGWKVKVEQFIIRHFYGIFMFIVGKIFIQLISVRFFWDFPLEHCVARHHLIGKADSLSSQDDD